MADEFGATLATKIKTHDQFWNDLESLQATAVMSLSVERQPQIATSFDESALSRLMYSASVFSQGADESDRRLAQRMSRN